MDKEYLKSLTKKEWKIPYSDKAMKVIQSFSLTEKTIFFIFSAIFIISGLSLLYQVNKLFLVEVPNYGGSLTEGVIGSPRFINPLLASSDIDKDLTSLIYSGLLKADSSGELSPDLADSYTISDDSLIYTFKIRDDAVFHDGTSVTADDVIFTIEKAQNSELKSPREANWSGVKVEKINDKTVSFILKQPYSSFIQNTTLGILPKHIWNKASIEEFPFSQFNTKPVGTGPYKIDYITYTSSGLPSEYHLVSFNKYALGKPYITKIIIKSYQNEADIIDAYKKGDIESLHSVSPKELPALKIASDEIILSPLPRIFGVFFNQNVAPIFVNKEVRQALNVVTDKQAIIDNILGGYGQAIDTPVPLKTMSEKEISTTSSDRIEKAKAILTKAGWSQNEDGVFVKKDKKETITLSFSISTGNVPELKETAYLLQKQWQELGAVVEVKIFEIGDLNQNIIKPRKYDSLLFGEVVGRDMDLYPFWHSSQRNSPGLNIALYTNLKADKLLENIRNTSNPELKQGYFNSFNKEITNDAPAVFTYSPYFIYIVPKKIKSVTIGQITTPGERFADVGKWYIETNNVWKIFIK
ncbi:MAG: peptide/nickel transport system substrate-binding protein [Parcubacteria bacterium C7867-006]|nr:MAG: peptide/nickel transport system substrate-binding protein [Parcubacteria bacterium C7867-006]